MGTLSSILFALFVGILTPWLSKLIGLRPLRGVRGRMSRRRNGDNNSQGHYTAMVSKQRILGVVFTGRGQMRLGER